MGGSRQEAAGSRRRVSGLTGEAGSTPCRCLLPAACCLLPAACCLLPPLASSAGTAHLPPMTEQPTATLPQPRRYDGVNWIGVKTLYLKEVRRFWKVGAQTV